MSNELCKLVTHFFYYTLIIALCAINSTLHIPHYFLRIYACTGKPTASTLSVITHY